MRIERTGPDWKLLKEDSPRLPLHKSIPEEFRVFTSQGWIVNFRLMVQSDEEFRTRVAWNFGVSPEVLRNDPWRRINVSLIDVADSSGAIQMTNRHVTAPAWREADMYRRVCRNLVTGVGHFLVVFVEALEAVFARVELPR